MAFTNFYLIAGGTGSADINAGSTIGAAVVAATTGGSWVNATNTFVSTGTPFGPAAVGDYVSIYADGATVTTYVAQIVTKVSTASVILSATIKYGIAPTDGANNRSAVVGGSWNTEQILAAGGLATTTVPQSTKINIKGNLTITTNRTIAIVGTTTTPLWLSGYNTTPGDLDNDTTNSLTKPAWTINATFSITSSGAHTIWSNLSITGNKSSGIVIPSSTPFIMERCRVENTSSNAAAVTVSANAQPQRYLYCWFKCSTTATTSGTFTSTSRNTFRGCVFEGGGLAGLNCINSTDIVVDKCVFLNNTGNGILFGTGGANTIDCTIYNSSSDGIKWTGTPNASGGYGIRGCLFNICGGFGINNASGVNTNLVDRTNNDFYNCSSGPENGFGDSPAFFQQTDAGTGAPGQVLSSTDMTPKSTSNAKNNGFPGIFENQSYSSYPYIGAVQPLAAGGSAVAIFNN